MKESEAREKFCPMLLTGLYALGVSGHSRDSIIISASKWLGAECMMWREGVPGSDGVSTGKCGLRG